MSFAQRVINPTFSLGKGQFGNSGANTSTLSGLRISAKVIKAGPPAMSTLQLDVYGMKLDMMNQLSTLGMAVQLQRRNTVTVEAGDAGGKLTKVFQGTIYNAWLDPEGAPDTVFRVEAQAGLIEAVSTSESTSYPNGPDVAVVMKTLAGKMGLAFENNGVSVHLPPGSYFYGSPRSQALQAAQAANIESVIDNGVLAIWPKNQARKGAVPLINKDTGMRGYPTYTSSGLRVVCLFNPAIIFGGQVKVESLLKPATNTWNVFRIDHDLDANVPGGRWFSTVDCYNPAFPQPVAL